MKRGILYLLVLLVLALALMACDEGEETSEPAEAPAQTEETSVEELAEVEQKAVEEPTAEVVEEEAQSDVPTEVVEPTEEEVAQEKAATAGAGDEDRPCALWIPAGEAAGETIQCGYVVVPAERDNPQGESVKLAYVLLKATGDNPSPDPIIHVSGGPGISATTRMTVVELINRYAPLREKRDIILYDQRGIGNSKPFFDCFAFMGEDAAAEVQTTADEFSRCQEGMREQGYPAETFSTAVSAADLVDVMQAFEYPAYNLYGISYGSRLLMSLMHHFPDDPLVRSIVLDSVDTLPEDFGTEFRAETHLLQQALFEAVFDECAADADCVEAYPDLRERFSALVEQLSQDPLTLDEYTTIDGDTLYRYFFPFAGAVQNIPYQPRMIAELEQGITTTLELMLSGDIPEPSTRTSFMPPEPAISQDLLDLYVNCQDPGTYDGDTEQTQQIELWDAPSEEVAEFLNSFCKPDSAAAAIKIIELNPRIFNYVITRYADDGIESPNHGLNSKLYCTEVFPFREEFSEIEANLHEAGMPNFFIEETIETLNAHADGCEAWQDALAAPTPEIYGDYPTLIFNGQFDRLTPPAFAERAAAAIPQAQYVPIPNAPHSIMGNNGDCPTEITLQFLDDPDSAVDAGCTEEMKVEFLEPSITEDEIGDKQMENNDTKPQYVTDLEGAYGPPSQEAFGSAVFFKTAVENDELEDLAKEVYQEFVGDKWQEWGEEAWMSPWKEAYRCPDDTKHDILAELRGIEDFDTQMAVEQILDNIEEPQKAQQDLAAAYDPAEVADLRVFTIGDGEAMSGLLLAGQRLNGAVTLLVFLLD